MTKHINEKWSILHTPTHSDYLVYWTGRKIMKKYGDLTANEFPKNLIYSLFPKNLIYSLF